MRTSPPPAPSPITAAPPATPPAPSPVTAAPPTTPPAPPVEPAPVADTVAQPVQTTTTTTSSTTTTTASSTPPPPPQTPAPAPPPAATVAVAAAAIDVPEPVTPPPAAAVSGDDVHRLVEMGFSESLAVKALAAAGGKLALATDMLLRHAVVEDTAPPGNAAPQPTPSHPTTKKTSTVSRLIRTSTRAQMQRSRQASMAPRDGDDDDAGMDPEMGEEEWFLDEGDEAAEKLFEILERRQLDQMLLETIEQLAMQLALTKGEAQLLLRHFNWSSERLQRFYFDNPESYQEQAGIKAEQVPTNPPGEIECLVCMNDVPFDETYAAGCGHRYCLQCWQGHLATMLTTLGANVGGTKCMFPNCGVKISFTTWQRLAAPADYDRYWYFLVKDFVEKNKKFVFCTNPSCGRAIHYKGAGKCSDVVECECGRRFCFNCGLEKHNPASCDQLRLWNEKNSDDSESLKLVKATSKQCFHCGFPTERNQGCNHMTCSRCRGEWCWMCRGDWKTHGSHTGGFYSCNKYESSEAKKIDDWASSFMADQDRWMHYYERFFNHGTSRRQLEERSTEITRRAEEYGITVCRSYDAVGEAIKLVLECREVLRYTYVYGFFLESKKLKPFFEYLQANAEGITERLAELIAKPPEEIDLDDLKNRIRITKRFLTNLVRGIEEGLVPS